MGLKQAVHRIFTALPKLQENSGKYNRGKCVLSANEEKKIYSDDCFLPSQHVFFL